MKLAASNIALPAWDHVHLLPRLPELGIKGLEISPSRAWDVSWNEVTAQDVTAYRQAAETAGLEVVGLHGLLYDHPELGLFREPEIVKRTADALVGISAICRDLGGKTLVLSGNRWCYGLEQMEAWNRAREFFDELMPRIEPHGTVFCLKPLGHDETDFCNTAEQCRLLASAVDHPSMGLHLDSCALMENDEMIHTPFAAIRGRLDLFHLSEPGGAEMGSTGRIDHADLRRHLAAISYFGWISMIQRNPDGEDGIDSLARSARFITETYLPIDTR